MKKLVAITTLALSFASASAFAATYKGVVADEMCAANPAKASSADHAAGATKCIKGGEKAVLIVGDKVYKVANQDKVVPYAGKSVTLEGTLADGTLTVASIKD
jgi:hypothetical protein